MKTPEDEAFDDIERRQLNGHQIKRIQAMARINEDFDEEYQKSRPTLAKYRVEEDDDTQVYKKPWVGLTEDEVKQCGFAVPFDGAQDWALRFSQAIEAKLKEKNA
jgi:hypothetical protein